MIKLKILSYDQETDTITFCCASDRTQSYTPTDYAPLAVQPSNLPDCSSEQAVLKHLGRMAKTICDQVAKKESFSQNLELVQTYNEWVGQEFTFEDSSLLTELQNNEVEL